MALYTFRQSSLPTEFRFTLACPPLSTGTRGKGTLKCHAFFSAFARRVKLIHTIGEIESPRPAIRDCKQSSRSDANINAILSYIYYNCMIAVLRNVYVRNKDSERRATRIFIRNLKASPPPFLFFIRPDYITYVQHNMNYTKCYFDSICVCNLIFYRSIQLSNHVLVFIIVSFIPRVSQRCRYFLSVV